jgi:hypothetical protein
VAHAPQQEKGLLSLAQKNLRKWRLLLMFRVKLSGRGWLLADLRRIGATKKGVPMNTRHNYFPL